ncbi:phage tail protein [Zooshikella marina]|uniref:phage tail protein n=1 Tax=Zooshikella ganghwensis TaxID=202772 RepID=UPI001BB0BB57|nr:phage tail protein [Zooshikella ganghwensis]MBU2709296.1 phage tail protein [Zooshikella ganghwensis]
MPQPMLILTNPQQQVRFRFSRNTAAYQSSQQTHHYRWSQQERISNTPTHQYIGPGQQSLTLKGVIYPYYLGGLEQVEQLRNEAGRGKPFLLVEGTGSVLGHFVIESIESEQTYFLEDGRPQKITFQLSLSRYGDGDAPLSNNPGANAG